MRNLTQILATTAVIAAAVFFSGVVVVPGRGRIQTARAEVWQIQHDMSATGVQISAAERIVAELTSLRDATRDFPYRIPDDHQMGEFLRDLGLILERAGMQNYIFQPRPAHTIEPARLPRGAPPQAVGIQVQPVLVQCEGRFGPLFAALRDMESLHRLSRIERLDAKADPERPGWLKVEMLITTFFWPVTKS